MLVHESYHCKSVTCCCFLQIRKCNTRQSDHNFPGKNCSVSHLDKLLLHIQARIGQQTDCLVLYSCSKLYFFVLLISQHLQYFPFNLIQIYSVCDKQSWNCALLPHSILSHDILRTHNYIAVCLIDNFKIIKGVEICSCSR